MARMWAFVVATKAAAIAPVGINKRVSARPIHPSTAAVCVLYKASQQHGKAARKLPEIS